MDKVCIKCGAKGAQDDLFCIHCGAKLEDKSVKNAPLSVGDYIFIGILLAIPVVNLVVMIVWATDAGTNLNRRNLAKAALIYMAVITAMTILLGIGFVRAVSLDNQTSPGYEEFEYYMEHPDFDEWGDMPFYGNEI